MLTCAHYPLIVSPSQLGQFPVNLRTNKDLIARVRRHFKAFLNRELFASDQRPILHIAHRARHNSIVGQFNLFTVREQHKTAICAEREMRVKRLKAPSNLRRSRSIKLTLTRAPSKKLSSSDRMTAMCQSGVSPKLSINCVMCFD